jgi:hypothetical protein
VYTIERHEIEPDGSVMNVHAGSSTPSGVRRQRPLGFDLVWTPFVDRLEQEPDSLCFPGTGLPNHRLQRTALRAAADAER